VREVCLFISSLFNYSDISRIDVYAALAAPIEDENTFSGKRFFLSQRGLGGFDFFLLCHCEESLVRRGNLILLKFL